MFNNTKNWSLSLGQEGMVTVRLHMIMLLALVALVGFATNNESSPSHVVGTIFATALITCFLVFTYTVAHFAVICRSGGTVKSVCFVPWGAIFQYGSATMIPARRQAYVMSMVTSLFLIFAGIFILSIGQPNPWSTAIHPLASFGLDWKNVDRSFVELFTKLAISQFCLNLIPLAPFASGYFMETWLIPRADRHKNQISASFLVSIGHAMALCLFGFAIVVRNQTSTFFDPNSFLGPAWVFPVLVGVFLSYVVHNRYHYLATIYSPGNTERKKSKKRRRVSHSTAVWEDPYTEEASVMRDSDSYEAVNQSDAEPDLVYDHLVDSTPLEDDLQSGGQEQRNKWEVWMEENQLSREDAKKLVEKTEDILLDQILEKVNATGLKSLSIDEKNLLERVSKRLRQK